MHQEFFCCGLSQKKTSAPDIIIHEWTRCYRSVFAQFTLCISKGNLQC